MLTRQYIFALLILLCPAWSIAAELWAPKPTANNRYNVIPTQNNSDDRGERRGNLYVSAKTLWFDVLTGTKRARNNKPTFAEWAEHFGVGLLRLPLYVRPEYVPGTTRPPMTVYQTSLIKAYAAANPDDADAQARADIDQFEQGCEALTAKGIDLMAYVGTPFLFEREGNEPIPRWNYRLRQELAPITRHVQLMAYDATMGTHEAWGAWKNEAARFYFDDLHRDGIATAGEPTPWTHDRDWVGGSFIDEDTLRSWEAKNPNATTAFAPRKPSGTFNGDPTGLMVPGVTHSPVFLWLDFKSASEKADPLGYIRECHERWPYAWLCISAPNIPAELMPQ